MYDRLTKLLQVTVQRKKKRSVSFWEKQWTLKSENQMRSLPTTCSEFTEHENNLFRKP